MECGGRLWSMESQDRGAHPECLDDALDILDSTAVDLEDRLAEALGETPQPQAALL